MSLVQLSTSQNALLERFIQTDKSCEPLIRELRTKLWYDVSELWLRLYKNSRFSGELLLDVYVGFVKITFETKINTLRLAQICLCFTSRLLNQHTASKFLSEVISRLEKDQKGSCEGSVVLRIEKAMCLMRGSKGGQVLDEEKVKEHLSDAKSRIEALSVVGHVDPYVNGYYYKTKSRYESRTKQYNRFYKSALQFLSYTSIKEELSVKEQEFWAYEIGLAALVGDEIYNFGELLSNPVIYKLRGNEKEWVLDLLTVFNKGDIEKYNIIMKDSAKKIQKIELFKDKLNFLERKIQLMAILELMFENTDSILTFEQIAIAARCNILKVEIVLMKALAIGLIKGVINQVNKTIEVTWCQPRVLDNSQIIKLRRKLARWYDKVDGVRKKIQ